MMMMMMMMMMTMIMMMISAGFVMSIPKDDKRGGARGVSYIICDTC